MNFNYVNFIKTISKVTEIERGGRAGESSIYSSQGWGWGME